jgi:hypothetical protein
MWVFETEIILNEIKSCGVSAITKVALFFGILVTFLVHPSLYATSRLLFASCQSLAITLITHKLQPACDSSHEHARAR